MTNLDPDGAFALQTDEVFAAYFVSLLTGPNYVPFGKRNLYVLKPETQFLSHDDGHSRSQPLTILDLSYLQVNGSIFVHTKNA